jgi:hypothetical protein
MEGVLMGTGVSEQFDERNVSFFMPHNSQQTLTPTTWFCGEIWSDA